METSINLLPCPFCGSNDLRGTINYIKCLECERNNLLYSFLVPRPIWNTRAPICSKGEEKELIKYYESEECQEWMNAPMGKPKSGTNNKICDCEIEPCIIHQEEVKSDFETKGNNLIKELERVDHHQVSEEIWRVAEFIKKFSKSGTNCQLVILGENEVTQFYRRWKGEQPGILMTNFIKALCAKFGKCGCVKSETKEIDYVGKCPECNKFGHVKLNCGCVNFPSTQEIEDVISLSDLWKFQVTRTGLQRDKRHLAQAIHKILTDGCVKAGGSKNGNLLVIPYLHWRPSQIKENYPKSIE